MNNLKTLGIVGGMGPLATQDFYQKVIELTPALDDPQHIPVVMVADTQIPLRIAAWEGRGPSPLPAMLTAAQHCVNAGATVLAMPCNTAHFWFDALAAAQPQIRWLHIANAAVQAAIDYRPGLRRLGLAGTHVTLAMRLYQNAAAQLAAPFVCVEPDAALQALISQAIAAVKAGQIAVASARFQAAIDGFVQQGCDAVMLACTELPVIAAQLKSPVPLIDATHALAQACVRTCKPS